MVNAAIVALMGIMGVGCEEFCPSYAPMYIDNTNPEVSVEYQDSPETEPIEADLREAKN